MGLLSKWWNALTRNSVIHSGSFLRAEMSRTTCSESPKSKRIVAFSGSCQPALYSPTASRASVAAILFTHVLNFIIRRNLPLRFPATHILFLLIQELVLDHQT